MPCLEIEREHCTAIPSLTPYPSVHASSPIDLFTRHHAHVYKQRMLPLPIYFPSYFAQALAHVIYSASLLSYSVYSGHQCDIWLFQCNCSYYNHHAFNCISTSLYLHSKISWIVHPMKKTALHAYQSHLHNNGHLNYPLTNTAISEAVNVMLWINYQSWKHKCLAFLSTTQAIGTSNDHNDSFNHLW